MKKFMKIILIILLLIGITGCGQEKETDALKFKNEYESYNGKVNERNQKEYRSVLIEEDNPIVYATAEDISLKMDRKESFYVYFGFSTCPWCRSMIENMLKAAKEHEVGTIYYVDVLEIRDTKTVNAEGEIELTREGDPFYMKLLDQMKDVLSDYSLSDADGNPVEVGEKRIYAPNVVAVVDGEAIEMTEGIADTLEDPYSELTEDMIEDSYDKLDCIFKCLEKSVMCKKNSC